MLQRFRQGNLLRAPLNRAQNREVLRPIVGLGVQSELITKWNTVKRQSSSTVFKDVSGPLEMQEASSVVTKESRVYGLFGAPLTAASSMARIEQNVATLVSPSGDSHVELFWGWLLTPFDQDTLTWDNQPHGAVYPTATITEDGTIDGDEAIRVVFSVDHNLQAGGGYIEIAGTPSNEYRGWYNAAEIVSDDTVLLIAPHEGNVSASNCTIESKLGYDILQGEDHIQYTSGDGATPQITYVGSDIPMQVIYSGAGGTGTNRAFKNQEPIVYGVYIEPAPVLGDHDISFGSIDSFEAISIEGDLTSN